MTSTSREHGKYLVIEVALSGSCDVVVNMTEKPEYSFIISGARASLPPLTVEKQMKHFIN